MWGMDSDPREHFCWRNVWSCWIGLDIGHYRSFIGRYLVARIALHRGGFKREQAKHFNAIPWYWRTAGYVVADGARATAQCSGDCGDGETVDQGEKLMQAAMPLFCGHLETPLSLKGAESNVNITISQNALQIVSNRVSELASRFDIR